MMLRWNDAELGELVVGATVARPGYGGIVVGPLASLRFDPQAISHCRPKPGRAWPLGDAVETPPAPPTDLAPRSMPSSPARPAHTGS